MGDLNPYLARVVDGVVQPPERRFQPSVSIRRYDDGLFVLAGTRPSGFTRERRRAWDPPQLAEFRASLHAGHDLHDALHRYLGEAVMVASIDDFFISQLPAWRWGFESVRPRDRYKREVITQSSRYTLKKAGWYGGDVVRLHGSVRPEHILEGRAQHPRKTTSEHDAICYAVNAAQEYVLVGEAKPHRDWSGTDSAAKFVSQARRKIREPFAQLYPHDLVYVFSAYQHHLFDGRSLTPWAADLVGELHDDERPMPVLFLPLTVSHRRLRRHILKELDNKEK